MAEFNIRAAAFDIDGTLYPNSSMYRATVGLVLRHPRLFRAFGRAREEVRREYPVQDLAARTAELTAEYLRWEVSRTEAAIRQVIYLQWERRLRTVSLYPGARELILWLRERGVPVATMSDFPTDSKLEILGLDGLWDVSFSSEETGYLKPRREPFERLVRELGVPAEEILYVGNSYRYDIVGADAVGLRTAHLTRRIPAHSRADFSFHVYADLKEWITKRIA